MEVAVLLCRRRRFAPVRRRFTRAAVIARAVYAAYLRMHLLCNI